EKFRKIREQKNSVKIYETSIIKKNGCIFFLIFENLERKLVILRTSSRKIIPKDFEAVETGEIETKKKKVEYLVCLCNHKNASALRRIFPFTRPQVLGLTPSIGTGDRIGLATPGHIRAMKECGVFPVLAQQSIREMDRTLRTPKDVLDDVSWAVFQEGYKDGFAADADHLKRKEDIDATFEAGFTMYTIDPSDCVDNYADGYDFETLTRKFEKLPWNKLKCRKEDYYRLYLGKKFTLSVPSQKNQTLEFSEETLLRAAVKYSAAIAHTVDMCMHLRRLFGRRKFDVEISVDETKEPTSPLEHFFVISELKRLGVKIQGLALRFVGRFEKAIDYIGDLEAFEKVFREHVFIAKACGPYKLSIHSGSDKFSIYPIIGRLASDILHLKTAGTSYLEAMRLVARHDPRLFREIIRYGLKCFERDRKSYSVSTNLFLVPDPSKVLDQDLEKAYLNDNNARQLLHITYGSVLTAKTNKDMWLFRQRIKKVLLENEEEHYETVAAHIKRHIEPLWPCKKNVIAK
ncbi:MAG: tagaturonate epimerase family protein, partial [Candidatus Bathyarchaeia archaeon]